MEINLSQTETFVHTAAFYYRYKTVHTPVLCRVPDSYPANYANPDLDSRAGKVTEFVGNYEFIKKIILALSILTTYDYFSTERITDFFQCRKNLRIFQIITRPGSSVGTLIPDPGTGRLYTGSCPFCCKV